MKNCSVLSICLSSFCVLSGCGGCHHLSAAISGVVLDSITHRPIPFVFIERKNSMGTTTETDSIGDFLYTEGPRAYSSGDSIALFFSADGYGTVRHAYPVFADKYAIAASDTVYLPPER